MTAFGQSLEFVEIARRALHSAVPFDQIAILLRNPRHHGPLVREALHSCVGAVVNDLRQQNRELDRRMQKQRA